MTLLPKEIKIFKVLLIVTILYQLLSVVVFSYLKPHSEIITYSVMFGGIALYVAFLVYLHRSANILNLNNIVKVKPWLLIVIQLVLTGKLIFPEIIVPIYIWVKSKKLLELDTIKTYDDRKFMLKS